MGELPINRSGGFFGGTVVRLDAELLVDPPTHRAVAAR
jgi:hypothetical protein